MTVITTLVARRPARLALGSLLALATLLTGAVAKGARLEVLCRARGKRRAGPYGATSTWNKIGQGRFVSDACTSSTQEAPACPAAELRSARPAAYDGAKPCSTDERAHPNGRVPASARCGLHGDREESLRPRAAAAFNALSLAHQKQTGQPLCVTDSYRPFDEQVRLRASRGREFAG
jgi:hypothetical protein